MAQSPAQENTSRRVQILDADYVPRDQAPNLPGARENAGRSRDGASALFAVMLCVALLALGIAVTRGDADDREVPAMVLATGTTRAAAAGSVSFPAPEEGGASLGVAVQTLSAPVAAYYSMKDCPLVPGAQVYAVDSDGPAAAAGLLPGDVITALDGTPIRTAEELAAVQRDTEAGQMVTLSVYRDGETLEITAELAPATGADENDFFHSLK